MRSVLVLCILICLSFASGCASGPQPHGAKIPPKCAFENIKYGSSYEQVEEELGQGGLLISESQKESKNEVFTRQIYRWGDGKTPCRVYLSFSNGKLSFKKYSGKCN